MLTWKCFQTVEITGIEMRYNAARNPEMYSHWPKSHPQIGSVLYLHCILTLFATYLLQLFTEHCLFLQRSIKCTTLSMFRNILYLLTQFHFVLCTSYKRGRLNSSTRLHFDSTQFQCITAWLSSVNHLYWCFPSTRGNRFQLNSNNSHYKHTGPIRNRSAKIPLK